MRTWPALRGEWILHRCDDLIAVDKPWGVATHEDGRSRIDDLKSRIASYFRFEGEQDYLGIVQRLDRDTSGVIVLSRTSAANRSLSRQFEGRNVAKHYDAIVEAPARWQPPKRIEHWLTSNGKGPLSVVAHRQRPREASAKRAVTDVIVKKRVGSRALVELRPVTGRTHQLRAQLAAIQAPIVGDLLYGGPPAHRLMLHARRLELEHPTTKAPLILSADTPADFAAALEAIDPVLPTDGRTLAARFRDAADRRYGLLADEALDVCRLINDIGDGLPGITLDRYGDWLSLSLYDDRSRALEDALVEAAQSLGVRGTYVKRRPKQASRVGDAGQADLAPPHASAGENAPSPLVVREHGADYRIRLDDGLATGLYLDQRDSRARIRELATGQRFLNLFAYTASFTVAAIAGGAKSTTTVDASGPALAWAAEHLADAGVSAGAPPHELIEADVFRWMKSANAKSRRWDLCVLDPPSFATTKRSVFRAASDYPKLAASVIALLDHGGRLLACTNHRGTTQHRFRRLLHRAAEQSGRTITQMKDLSTPEDFPPPPGGSSHLKSLLITFD